MDGETEEDELSVRWVGVATSACLNRAVRERCRLSLGCRGHCKPHAAIDRTRHGSNKEGGEENGQIGA